MLDQTLAYRVLWERDRGPIPQGWHLHHTCETPVCVNLDHLEPMSPEAHSQLHGDQRRRKTMT